MGKPCNAATYREATRKLAASVNPKVLVEVGVYAGALSMMWECPGCGAKSQAQLYKESRA